jgi:two-component system sensor histidine kinase/response regulator
MPEPSGAAIDRAVIEELLEATGGDRGFLLELVDAYLADAPAQLAAMRRAVVDGSATDLVRPTHTLKSSSAALGATGLAERCRVLEAQARSGGLEGLGDAVEAIAAELEAATGELQIVAAEA